MIGARAPNVAQHKRPARLRGAVMGRVNVAGEADERASRGGLRCVNRRDAAIACVQHLVRATVWRDGSRDRPTDFAAGRRQGAAMRCSWEQQPQPAVAAELSVEHVQLCGW